MEFVRLLADAFLNHLFLMIKVWLLSMFPKKTTPDELLGSHN